MGQEWMLILAIVAGALGGLLSGMLGVGGGLVFVPVFSQFLTWLQVPPQEQVLFILANSLTVIVFVGAAGVYKQYKAGNFFPQALLNTAVPGIVASFVVNYIIRTTGWYSKEKFVLFFIAILLFTLYRMVLKLKNKSPSADFIPVNSIKKSGFWLAGLLSGLFVSVSGLGGGIIMVPFFTNRLKMEMKTAVSVSLGVIALMALQSCLFYLAQNDAPVIKNASLQTGYVLWGMILPVLPGAILLSQLGVKLSLKMGTKSLTAIFALFIAITIVKMVLELI